MSEAPVADARPTSPRRRALAIVAGIASLASIAWLASQLFGGGEAARLEAPDPANELADLPPELTVELHHGETPHRTLRTATPGDRMLVRAKAAAAFRIYLNGETLIASCPDDDACAQLGPELQLELTLEAPGEYRAILLHGSGAPPAPTSSMNDDLAAARAAGFSTLKATPVQVHAQEAR